MKNRKKGILQIRFEETENLLFSVPFSMKLPLKTNGVTVSGGDFVSSMYGLMNEVSSLICQFFFMTLFFVFTT